MRPEPTTVTVSGERGGTAALPQTFSPVVGWRDLVTLLKLRIDALVVLVALAAAVTAGRSNPATLATLGAACLLAAAGASSLNHYLDRDIDARMARTRARPLPAGRVDPRVALWLGVVLILASQAVAARLGLLPALYLLAGAITYALVYTWWLKPRTQWNIVVGGAAGSFAALAGWAVAESTLAPAPILLAAVLFLWTPSHFWSLAIAIERDYREAGVPMLPALVGTRRAADAVVLNTALLVVASLVLAGFVGWPYLVLAVPAGLGFMGCVLWLRRSPDPARAWPAFKLSGLYLLALLVGLVLSVLA